MGRTVTVPKSKTEETHKDPSFFEGATWFSSGRVFAAMDMLGNMFEDS
jgi:hypothetical protein